MLKLVAISIVWILSSAVHSGMTDVIAETETAEKTILELHDTTITISEEELSDATNNETTEENVVVPNITDLDLRKNEVRTTTSTTTSTIMPATTTTTPTTTTTFRIITTTISSSISTKSKTSTTSTSTLFSTTSTTNNMTSTNENMILSFNLNYLYLLLIIPFAGILIGACYYCKRRKKKEGYMEPKVHKTRRFSTPSWVFSEPDFHDEEVTTLEQEKQ